MGGRVLHVLVAAAAVVVLAAVGADHAASGSGVSEAQSGGIFRISLAAASGIDYMDPALASTPPGWALLDTTCARLMSYPDVAPPAGFRLQPEVAADFPTVSRDGKTFTFRLRTGFRFSDGEPGARDRVRPRDQPRDLAGDAIARPPVRPRHCRCRQGRDRQGADRFRRRRARQHARRPVHPSGARFPSRTASTYFCAVPPTLPDRSRGSRRVSRGRAVLRLRLPPGRADRPATEPVLRRDAAPTTSTASRSISRPRPRRTCCDVSTAARRTGATRSPGSTSTRRWGSSRSTGRTARSSTSGRD